MKLNFESIISGSPPLKNKTKRWSSLEYNLCLLFENNLFYLIVLLSF